MNFLGSADDESVLIAFEHPLNMHALFDGRMLESRVYEPDVGGQWTHHTLTNNTKYILIQSNADNLIKCPVNNVINWILRAWIDSFDRLTPWHALSRTYEHVRTSGHRWTRQCMVELRLVNGVWFRIPFGDAVARYACFGWDFGPTSRFSVGNSVSCTDGPQLFCSPNDET